MVDYAVDEIILYMTKYSSLVNQITESALFCFIVKTFLWWTRWQSNNSPHWCTRSRKEHPTVSGNSFIVKLFSWTRLRKERCFIVKSFSCMVDQVAEKSTTCSYLRSICHWCNRSLKENFTVLLSNSSYSRPGCIEITHQLHGVIDKVFTIHWWTRLQKEHFTVLLSNRSHSGPGPYFIKVKIILSLKFKINLIFIW